AMAIATHVYRTDPAGRCAAFPSVQPAARPRRMGRFVPGGATSQRAPQSGPGEAAVAAVNGAAGWLDPHDAAGAPEICIRDDVGFFLAGAGNRRRLPA